MFFTRGLSDYQEAEYLKTLWKYMHIMLRKKKKSPQSLPKVLILLNKIYTSVIIEIIWCVASENTLRQERIT